jgi:hypothetical protein
MESETDPDPHEIAAEILLDRPNIDAAEPNTDARSGAQYIDIEFSPSQHASDFNLSLKIEDFQQCCLRVARQTKNITRRFLREGQSIFDLLYCRRRRWLAEA